MHDLSDRLRLPHQLPGREPDVVRMLEANEHTNMERPAVVLVAGARDIRAKGTSALPYPPTLVDAAARLPAGGMDDTTLLHAAQDIATEARLPELLTRLMRIALDHAGADRGALLLKEKGRWVIPVLGRLGLLPQPDIVAHAPPIAARQAVSIPIVRFVVRTCQPLVIQDAAHTARLARGRRPREAAPRSILCLPLIAQGRLEAILYLENTQTTGAFTPDRVGALRWLSTQMAIAIDHARRYQRLEGELRQNSRMLSAAIAARRRVEEALRRQEQQFRTLVEDSPDMISRFDRQMRRVYVSPAASTLLGRPPEELIGKTCADLGFPEAVCAAWHQALAEVFESGRPLSFQTELPLPERRLAVQVRLAPELAADGSVEAVLSITSDITELKQAEQAMRAAKESAEAAQRGAEAAKREEEARRRDAERRRQTAESLRDVLAILNSDRGLEEVLDYIVLQAHRLLGSQAAIVYRLPETAAGVPLQSTFGVAHRPVLESCLRVSPATLRDSLLLHGAIALGDTAELAASGVAGAGREPDEPADFVIPLVPAFQAVLAAPILVGGDLYGGLALYYSAARPFVAEELDLVGTLSEQVALAVENADLRNQVKQASATAERVRLAGDLHDAVTQAVFSACLIADALPEVWEADPTEGRRGLKELRQLTRGALAELRSLLVELHPAALAEKRLGDLLQQLTEAMSGRLRAPIALEAYEDGGTTPPAVRIALYRIAQEALNNIAKHARARRVLIRMRSQGGRVVLRVQDDGVGFDPARLASGAQGTAVKRERVRRGGSGSAGRASAGESVAEGGGAHRSGHLGVAIMQERARSIGAGFELRSRPGRGTTLVVRWPAGEGRPIDGE